MAITKARKLQWLAIVREALIRSGESPSFADSIVDEITGDSRDLDNEDQQVAFERCSSMAAECSGLKDPVES